MNKLNFDINTVEFEYGNRKYKIETGKVARQATASVMAVSYTHLTLPTSG